MVFTPAHTLSKKSARQDCNVFIWCGLAQKLSMGWHIDDDTLFTVSSGYRWIDAAIEAYWGNSETVKSYALFPVVVRPYGVFAYGVKQNGSPLLRDSQEKLTPGDYAMYTTDGSTLHASYLFKPPSFSFSNLQKFMEEQDPALAAKGFIPSSFAQQVLKRDDQCIFTGAVQSNAGNSQALVVTWIFPPFLGYMLSDDVYLETKYREDPDSIDFSDFTVVTNAISARKDIATLFFENKLGVDVDDKYRIVLFERSQHPDGEPLLRSHLTLVDGPYRPSDRFLRLHFRHCIVVSVCGGDAADDYRDQEIDCFMEELGVFDNEMDITDPRWTTPLGIEVYASLLRQKMAEYAEHEEEEL